MSLEEKPSDRDINRAAAYGNLSEVKELLKRDPDLVSTEYGYFTPLHEAARSGQKDVAELLIAHGAGVNAKMHHNDATPLHEAAEYGHKNVAELLIAHGADVNARVTHIGYTPLQWAVDKGHKDVVALLLADGADANAADKYGNTPLHLAAQAGRKDVVELLLAHGADVNATDNYDNAPLHLAVYRDHRDVVKLLRKHASVPKYELVALSAATVPSLVSGLAARVFPALPLWAVLAVAVLAVPITFLVVARLAPSVLAGIRRYVIRDLSDLLVITIASAVASVYTGLVARIFPSFPTWGIVVVGVVAVALALALTVGVMWAVGNGSEYLNKAKGVITRAKEAAAERKQAARERRRERRNEKPAVSALMRDAMKVLGADADERNPASTDAHGERELQSTQQRDTRTQERRSTSAKSNEPCPECGFPLTANMAERDVIVTFVSAAAHFACPKCDAKLRAPLHQITKNRGVNVRCSCGRTTHIPPSVWCSTCGNSLSSGWQSTLSPGSQ